MSAVEHLQDDDDELIPDQYLLITVSQCTFAMAIERIRECLAYTNVTPVPKMPPWMAGVFNLRGSVVPVISLARRFDMTESQISPTTCIVIAEADCGGEKRLMGLIVDEVLAVHEIKPESIDARPAFGHAVRADFIAGACELEGRVAIVLDGQKVLAIEEMAEKARSWSTARTNATPRADAASSMSQDDQA